MDATKTKTVILRYGFRNSDRVSKKVLKLICKVNSNNFLEDLVAIQQDNQIFHTTIHSAKGENKLSRVHLQLEHPELICDRDRQKFPEILDSPLPIWDTLNYPYSVITLPIHWGADRSRNLYSKMKQKELTEHATRIIDLSEDPSGREYIGNVSIYLLPSAHSTYKKFEKWTQKSRYDRYLLDIFDGFTPWVGAFFYMRIIKGLWSSSEQPHAQGHS